MQNKNMGMIISTIVAVVVLVLIIMAARTALKSNQAPADGGTTAPAVSLTVKTVAEGHGAGAVNGDALAVWYTGKLSDGTVFDSNVDPKFGHTQPFSLTLGEHRVIPGWEQGLLGIKEGEKRHLTIPSELGYGANGHLPTIPPNATLEFDVEAISIHHS